MKDLPQFVKISPRVSKALTLGLPVVALESTVITHGLPYPENINLAQDMEKEIDQLGVTPATIAVLDGVIQVGLNPMQLDRLATETGLSKISSRDYAGVISQKRSGGTTVAGTLVVANLVGIDVFATGGIGGVHRLPRFDISADLVQLARSRVVVVCAGAKAILDLPGTLEFLETYRIPVVGFQTNEFPAFYSKSSGFQVSVRANSPGEIASIANIHWGLGLESAILVTVPPPEEVALPREKVQNAIDQALDDAERKGIRGQEMTPFLLKRVTDLTGGTSLKANLGLLCNNARIAALISKQM
ncbi:MAG: pseudouridine-5'-phosphate glycosidase [Anaerolineales bacterium]|nr:pseudouridine-5'-phosphate glycosidase [Anaerolineales bacterium]